MISSTPAYVWTPDFAQWSAVTVGLGRFHATAGLRHAKYSIMASLAQFG